MGMNPDYPHEIRQFESMEDLLAAGNVPLSEEEARELRSMSPRQRSEWLRARARNEALHKYLATARSVADAWGVYDACVLPKRAPRIQRDETRMAFFAGCDWVLKRVIGASENEEYGMALLSELTAELREYMEDYAAAHSISRPRDARRGKL